MTTRFADSSHYIFSVVLRLSPFRSSLVPRLDYDEASCSDIVDGHGFFRPHSGGAVHVNFGYGRSNSQDDLSYVK